MVAVVTMNSIIESVHVDDYYKPVKVINPGQNKLIIKGVPVCTINATFELHENSDGSKKHPFTAMSPNSKITIGGVPVLMDNFTSSCGDISNKISNPDNTFDA